MMTQTKCSHRSQMYGLLHGLRFHYAYTVSTEVYGDGEVLRCGDIK